MCNDLNIVINSPRMQVQYRDVFSARFFSFVVLSQKVAAYVGGRQVLRHLTDLYFCALFFTLPSPLFFFPSSLYHVPSLACSYESSDEVLPHTPRLTHFPTVSGSPASLANSMSTPRRRRHTPSDM